MIRLPLTIQWRWLAAGLALVAALAGANPVQAQFTDPPPPAAYAVQGVTLVNASGRTEPNVTIIVRDGLIVAIGRDVTVPADAMLLETDSMFVYPGLVDAHGNPVFTFPEREPTGDASRSWSLPRDVQGFMPHRRVADALETDGNALQQQRRTGIVASAVHPMGRLMQGQSTVIMHRITTKTPSDLVLRPVLGPTMTFRGAQGGYPSTLFAVIAFYRQMFADAGHHAQQVEAFASDAQGLRPPRWDADLDALHLAVQEQQPFFVEADLARDIRRVLQLADELGFRPVIVGGEEAWRVAADLRAANVPVLVSVDFPEPNRWDPDDEPELDAAAAREKQRIEDAYRNPGRLAEAGVTFALTSGGGDADLLEGARRAVEYGLSERAALAALTSTPVSLLGIDHLPIIERDMAATFIVTTGPLLGEDTDVAYTFVEGELEEGETAAAGEPSEAPAVTMSGSWSVELETPAGTFEVELSLEQDGATFGGTAQSVFGEAAVEDGIVSGSDVTFVIVANMGGQAFRIEMSGTVDGDRASGRGDSPQGAFEWTARRTGGGV